MLTKIVLPENAEHNDGWNESTDAESVQNCRRVDAFQIGLQHIRDARQDAMDISKIYSQALEFLRLADSIVTFKRRFKSHFYTRILATREEAWQWFRSCIYVAYNALT